MIEVVQLMMGFTWVMICGKGRIIVYTSETFHCRDSAAEAGRAYRSAFWAMADEIDYRMARNI